MCTVKTSDQSQRWIIVIYDQYFCNISDMKRALLPKAHPFSLIVFFLDFTWDLLSFSYFILLWFYPWQMSPPYCGCLQLTFFRLFPFVVRSCWSGRGWSTCRACYLIWPMRPERNLLQLYDWIPSVWILTGKLQFSHHQHINRSIFFLHDQKGNLAWGESRISKGWTPIYYPAKL